MPRIQLQIQAGPLKGQRAQFNQDVVRFGREADNDVVLAGKFLSRHHGELRFGDGQWWLVNESANGAEINNKRVTKKPRAVQDRDIISVGKELMFQVMIETAAAQVADTQPTTVAEAPSSEADDISRKTKMWIGIGIYLALSVVALLFLYTLKETPEDSVPQAVELTDTFIRNEIIKLPIGLPVDERAMERCLNDANELYNRLDSSANALYRCNDNYEKAIVYSGRSTLVNGTYQRRFLDIQDRLVAEVTRLYRDACDKSNNNHQDADKAFKRVQEIYPDYASPIYKNCEDHLQEIMAKRKKRRRSR